MFMGLINERTELVEVFHSARRCHLRNRHHFNTALFTLYILISEYAVGCTKVDTYTVFGGMNWHLHYSSTSAGARIEVS
ncbi:Uncharacterised protein [Vibrio cholerae]|uniref:Uncharacterized protein n=1 Tax=Vibrio cholerae TaxID=666 RepID=A0A655VTT9_VIBCL|nr:Uncharacterised protein [Vibrio cholerae]CSA56881.1 Uncharacterised protein [Vibrio cholerae]CSB49046.1 Uncharacterised protein [Vibrio cholerae]CSB55496.1 Uncharacterised protein [Vibrio cholerae]CSB65110.1 Uncharacterised protein [Vibrio cholerae]